MRTTTDKSKFPRRSVFRARRIWGVFLFSGLACSQLLRAVPGPNSASANSDSTPLAGKSTDRAHGTAKETASLQSLPAESAPLESRMTVACEADDQLSPEAAERVALTLLALPPPVPDTWQDMARIANWTRAAQLIEALPTADKQLPGARYVLAVAAQETHRCDVTLQALEGLDSLLPLLGTEIDELRAICQLEMGPFDAAIAYFEAQNSAKGLIHAARARFRAGNLKAASATIRRAIKRVHRRGGSAKRRLQDEANARRLRAEIAIARKHPKIATQDYRWLATEAITLPAGSLAAEQFEKLSAKKLNKQERLTRASALANNGQLMAALAELTLLEQAPGKAPAAVEIAATKAWAHYHTRADYAAAATLFHQAAELDKAKRPRFLYYEAKSHSRSHQDDRAIDEYNALAKAFPGTGYVEQSLFRVARLRYGLARFAEAEKGYVSYLKHYPGGRYAKGARYDLAICRLALKQRTEKAGKTFAKLARNTGSPDQRALFKHLQGVALELADKQEAAIEQYEEVLQDSPVTFAALASAAHLRDLGKHAPHRRHLIASLGGDKPLSKFSSQLPNKAQLLADWGLHTDAERALFEQRKQLTRRDPQNRSQTMCQLYGTLDRGFRRYSLAFKLMRSHELGQAPSPDNLWAWQCAYPAPYQGIVREVESRYQLPESLVHAVMRQESGFRPNVVSPVGAVGLMQLMPRTARLAALDITQRPGNPVAPDPTRPKNVRNNVELGGFYLSKLLGMLNDQMPLAVAAYNAGPSAVSRWLQGGDRLPVDIWVARIPYRETRHYVSRVMGNWLAYRYLSDPSQLPELKLALVEGTRPDPEAY